MAESPTFLSINFGMGSLKVAEFDQLPEGRLYLRDYVIRPLGVEGTLESKREGALQNAISEVFAERQYAPGKAMVVAPGSQVFTKPIKFPKVDNSKVSQLIQYEAQQNIPFALEEAVWDKQILDGSDSEVEVLLVAAKQPVVEGIGRVCESVKQDITIIDAPAPALLNAYRYNYHDYDGCSLILDIGAKTSNVIVVEGDNFFVKHVPIGSDNITRDFSTESKMRIPEAEQIKVEQGFVGLGGAYAEPDNEYQAAISKIARQVMTRLSIQVNQAIQFFQKQQKGSKPTRVLLAGSATTLPYTAEFFNEKLQLDVEYFNPFRNIEVDPEIAESLAPVAHGFGEVVGAAIRNGNQCPFELNLVPKSSQQAKDFSRKQPWIFASAGVLAATLGILGLLLLQITQETNSAASDIQNKVSPLQSNSSELQGVLSEIGNLTNKVVTLQEIRARQAILPEVLSEVRKVFLETEREISGGANNMGIWVHQMEFGDLAQSIDPTITADNDEEEEGYSEASTAAPAMSAEMMQLYGIGDPYGGLNMQNDPYASDIGGDSSTGAVVEEDEGDGIRNIVLQCSAINQSALDPAANTRLVTKVVENIKKSGLFTDRSGSADEIPPVKPDDLTFEFDLHLHLSKPL